MGCTLIARTCNHLWIFKFTSNSLGRHTARWKDPRERRACTEIATGTPAAAHGKMRRRRGTGKGKKAHALGIWGIGNVFTTKLFTALPHGTLSTTRMMGGLCQWLFWWYRVLF